MSVPSSARLLQGTDRGWGVGRAPLKSERTPDRGDRWHPRCCCPLACLWVCGGCIQSKFSCLSIGMACSKNWVRRRSRICSLNFRRRSSFVIIVFQLLVSRVQSMGRLFQAIEIQVQINQAVNNNGGEPTILGWRGTGCVCLGGRKKRQEGYHIHYVTIACDPTSRAWAARSMGEWEEGWKRKSGSPNKIEGHGFCSSSGSFIARGKGSV